MASSPVGTPWSKGAHTDTVGAERRGRQEANIFTDAELHVHSVSVIAYSVLAGLGVAVSSLLLREMLSAKAFAYSTVATQVGTLIILCLVRAPVAAPFPRPPPQARKRTPRRYGPHPFTEQGGVGGGQRAGRRRRR